MSLDPCTRCHLNPAILQRGNERICHECADKELIRVTNATQGGKIIEMLRKDATDLLNQPPPIIDQAESIANEFKQKIENNCPSWVKSVSVIFENEAGALYQVRITKQEQNAIASKIVLNRQTGRKELMSHHVFIVSAENLIRADAIIEKVANFDTEDATPSDFKDIVKDAKKLQDDLRK